MGGSTSKDQEQVFNQTPELSYPGPAVEYNFINTEVSMTSNASFLKNMITTNVDSYYPILGRKYDEGFRMSSFHRVPGAEQTRGFFNMSIILPFQAVFWRCPQLPSQRGMWQLCIVKSVMVTQTMSDGLISDRTVGDTSHIHRAIVDNAKLGGRLICIEMTGQEQSQGFRAAMSGVSPIMGVDLFFDMPTNQTTDLYMYKSTSCPVTIHGTMTGPVCSCDWNGILDSHLSQGWRLVEIFFDMGMQQRAFSSTASVNSVWFFEKPASKVQDNRPVYQGMVIIHYIRYSQGFFGAHVKANWEPIIQQMGNHGWEFACFVETPETRVTGFGKAKTKILLIFQRPIFPTDQRNVPTISGMSYPGISDSPP